MTKKILSLIAIILAVVLFLYIMFKIIQALSLIGIVWFVVYFMGYDV